MEWISVKDRLPEHACRVLVAILNEDMGRNTFYHVDLGSYCCCKGWDISKNLGFIAKPTHWMPLPLPPEDI